MDVMVTGIGDPIAQGIIQGLRERRDVRIIGADQFTNSILARFRRKK